MAGGGRILESGDKLDDTVLEAVLRRDVQQHQVLMAEQDPVGDLFMCCARYNVALQVVIIHGSVNDPSVLDAGVP